MVKGRKTEEPKINMDTFEAPEAPDYLDSIGKKRFIEVCKDLHELGLYSETDLDQVELYARTYSLYRRLEEQSRGKEFNPPLPNGYVYANPVFIESNKALKQAEFILRKLGLSPSSRQSKAKTKGSVDNKWKRIL